MRSARASSTWSPAASRTGSPRSASTTTCSVQSSGRRSALRTRRRRRRALAAIPPRPCSSAVSIASSRKVSAQANSPIAIITSARSGRRASLARLSVGMSATARRRRFAAAGMSPRENARSPGREESGGRPGSELAAVLVQGAELGEALVRLLEVVAEDLLVLDGSVAILVDAVGPGDEALVENRAGALEEAPVGGVADQDVAKAIPRFRREVGPLGPGEPLLRQRLEGRRRRPRGPAPGRALGRPPWTKTCPTTLAAPITSRSSASRLSRRAARRA